MSLTTWPAVLRSLVTEDGGKCSCTPNFPSPLRGEDQGGGKSASRARTDARSWPLGSPARFVTIRPMPSGGFGLACVNDSSKAGASGDKLPSGLKSSTSRVSQRGWSSRLMAASTAGARSRMLRDSLGLRPTASRCSVSGTTRCSPAPMGCWRRSARPCRNERWIDPPPRPSATRGEVWSVPRYALKRRERDLCIRRGRANSGRDEAGSLGAAPGAPFAGGAEAAAWRRSLLPCGGGLGWGVHRA